MRGWGVSNRAGPIPRGSDMTDQQIRFQDGASYEKMMGVWSRIAGEVFLDWLNPPAGLAWADVGCGSGALTELIVERCAPALVEGVDPSEAQLVFARQRHAANLARFQVGDAMALPFADKSLDAAAMALVIFFVPEPAKGVAEMARVVRPGGTVSAYAWDLLGGGFPLEPVHEQMRGMNTPPKMPPHPEAAELANLKALWAGAGLTEIETRVITIERRFEDFDDFWNTALLSPGIKPLVEAMTPADIERMKAGARTHVRTDPTGHVVHSARAHAVKGVVPA